MSHVNYQRWVGLIETICTREFANVRPQVFEIGAGTGVLGALLREKGYRYTGSDLSIAMCKEAMKRQLPFFCADARRLPVKKQFNMILFLYDGINYLQKIEDYTRLCEQMYECLYDGGLVLFDITTETNSLSHFYNAIDGEDFGRAAYIRHSYYERGPRIQHNDFTIFFQEPKDDCCFKKVKEYHKQRIFSPREIEAAIPENLFSVKGIFDNYSFRRYNDSSERIHFLLKKK